jgi:hypothetical protein
MGRGVADTVALSYGKVIGSFVKTVIDSADADADPDVVPLTGKVVLRPDIAYFIKDDVMVFPQAISCDLVDGQLVDPSGNVGIKLVASDTPDISAPGFTYTVSYSLSDGASPLASSFQVLAGATVDLSVVVPIAVSAGVPITKGDKGDQGDPGPDTPGAPIFFKWDGTHYQPAALKADLTRAKIVVGPVNPATDGVVMQALDQWINTAP